MTTTCQHCGGPFHVAKSDQVLPDQCANCNGYLGDDRVEELDEDPNPLDVKLDTPTPGVTWRIGDEFFVPDPVLPANRNRAMRTLVDRIFGYGRALD